MRLGKQSAPRAPCGTKLMIAEWMSAKPERVRFFANWLIQSRALELQLARSIAGNEYNRQKVTINCSVREHKRCSCQQTNRRLAALASRLLDEAGGASFWSFLLDTD